MEYNKNEYATGHGEEPVVTSERLKQETQIRGWLAFFLFAIVVGGIVSAVYPICKFNVEESGGSLVLALTDPVLGALLLAVALYTLYAFTRRKPNAVFLAKMYVVAVFATNLFVLLLGNYEEKGLGSLSQILRSLIWAVVWFCYLSVSNQVKEVIPISFRKVYKRDYYLLGALVIIPLLFLAYGFSGVIDSQQKDTEAFLKEVVLERGEYTDGRVVFSSPDEFTCERTEIENPHITVFNMQYEEEASITLYSDYDTDQSEKNFLLYWENWKDEETEGCTETPISCRKSVIDGKTYYCKVMKYENENYLWYWRFILLFDNASSKVCIVSCYDGGEDSYVKKFLKTIRFTPTAGK